MKRSPRGKFKPDPSLRQITEFFKTPPKNELGNSATPSSSVEKTPQQQMKQLSLIEMSNKKRSDEVTVSNCKRKLELVPVIEKLSDLAVKHKMESYDNSNNTLQSNDQDNNNTKNGSEDDDLPECLSQSDASPSKLTTSNFIHRKYKFDINYILEEREQKQESNLQLKQMEEELKKEEIHLDEQLDEIDDFKLKKTLKYNIQNVIKQDPPGIQLFDLSRYLNLYSNPRPPIQPENTNKSELDKLFDNLTSTHCIPRFINLIRLSVFPEKLCDRPWIVSYIFHAMASHNDNQSTHSSYQILAAVNKICRETKTLKWKPTILDFVAVLANHGADLQRLITNYNSEYHDMLKGKYMNEPKMKIENNDQSESNTTLMNLSLVFQTITLYVQLPEAYSDEERAFMLFAAISVLLDKLVNDISLIDQIRSSVDAIISSFSEKFWINELNKLVENLLTISDHHHDRVYIVRAMPYTSRGHRLQQLLSFAALVQLLKVECKEEMLSVQINSLLSICNKTTLNALNDNYKLHSALELINAFITKELEIGSMTQETLELIKSVLRDVNSKLIDRLYKWDVTIVKNVITQMMGRLSLLKDTLPSNQKTLFQYEKIIPEYQEISNCPDDEMSDEIDDQDLSDLDYDD